RLRLPRPLQRAPAARPRAAAERVRSPAGAGRGVRLRAARSAHPEGRRHVHVLQRLPARRGSGSAARRLPAVVGAGRGRGRRAPVRRKPVLAARRVRVPRTRHAAAAVAAGASLLVAACSNAQTVKQTITAQTIGGKAGFSVAALTVTHGSKVELIVKN